MAKKISLYGILTALCIVAGYVEHFINLDFIAPGLKIGLANTVVLLLVAKGDIKGAIVVNTVRILLSALLFSAPSVLIYSFAGAFASMLLIWVLSRLNRFSLIGLSVAGAVAHNATQSAVAFLLLGKGVLYYLPFLLIAAVVGGLLTGSIATIVFKRSDI